MKPVALLFLGVLLVTTLTSTAQPAHSYTTYIVQPGDYLVSIALKFGVPWQGIARLNQISEPYTIYPGQVLRIPESACSPHPDDCYTVKSGDSLYIIGEKFHVDWKAIAKVNGIDSPYLIYPGELLLVPGMDDRSNSS